MVGGIRYSLKNKSKTSIKDANWQKERDKSEWKKADDIGGKPEMVIEEEKEKVEPEMGSIIHDENACSSSSSSSPCAVDDSDAKWESLLPENYKDVISRSASASSLNSLSKEELYSHLREHPIIIDNGTKRFAIDKKSGKICYMIGAKGLEIEHEEKPEHWQRKSLPESSFSRVAELRSVYWLDIKGRIETNILSPKSTYGAYFVYKLSQSSRVFEKYPVEFQVYFQGEGEVSGHRDWPKVILDPSEDEQQRIQVREDGWLEVELGEFFNDGGEDHQVVVCSILHTKTYFEKSGLVVEGIVFRPKAGK